MAICTKETGKCPICNNYLEPLPSLVASMTGMNGFYCDKCRKAFQKSLGCDGEIKKVWWGGKEIDCVCQKCGKSYGKGYLAREKFLESFCTV